MGAEPGAGATASDRQERRSHSDTLLRLIWRPYRFQLAREMVTSQGAWNLRQGWLLRLEGAEGRVGWGEAALPPGAEPLPPASTPVPTEVMPVRRQRPGRGDAAATSVHSPETPASAHLARAGDIRQGAIDPSVLPPELHQAELEDRLPRLPLPLACALGMGLAERDGLGSVDRGGWLKAPPSALLLPAGAAALAALERALADLSAGPGRTRTVGPHSQASPGDPPLTVKWKVAAGDDACEREVLEKLLARLPAGARLRLDANGGWDRATAWRWAERLAGEPRLEWLEQPLPPGDREGLEALARRLPVALDESLRLHPDWMAASWRGWQVRRPLAEGDPRPLLAALRAGTPRLMLSTALETGIGRRFLHHLAGLQALGPTPTAPGLAPGWCPRGELFARDPETVWEAAR